MKLLKKFTALLLSLIIPFQFTGCYDYRETKDMSIASGLAVDKDKGNNKIILTIETLKITVTEQGTKTTGELVEVEGDTIFDAARNAIAKVGKKIYWGHAKVVIVSQQIARSGLIEVLDWINRDAEMRSEMFLLISKEATARDVLQRTSGANEIRFFNLAKIVSNQKRLSKAEFDKDVGITIQYLRKKSISLTIPMIRLVTKGGKTSAETAETAIFKGDKMIGQINEEETKTMLFIRNGLKGGLIILPNACDTGADVALEIFSNKTKVKTAYNDGMITINIDIHPDVDIAEINKDVDFMDLKNQEKLKAYADEKLKKDVESLVEKVQKSNYGDIFDFGKFVQMQIPSVWRTVEEDWEEVFNTLNVNVKVDINIKGSARSSKPIKVGG